MVHESTEMPSSEREEDDGRCAAGKIRLPRRDRWLECQCRGFLWIVSARVAHVVPGEC